MQKNLTELVFILDRSGSMGGLESDTIGGYNAMLAKQRKEKGEAFVTTVLFDDAYELLHDRIAIKGIAPMTDEQYFVRGCTALLDAIGKTINKIDNAIRHTLAAERPKKVLFVITTDGIENASTKFSYADIRTMIGRQKEKHGWEFLFLGANMDAIAEAERFGISADRAASYLADSSGTELNYAVLSDIITELRVNKSIPAQWKEKIDADHTLRG